MWRAGPTRHSCPGSGRRKRPGDRATTAGGGTQEAWPRPGPTSRNQGKPRRRHQQGCSLQRGRVLQRGPGDLGIRALPRVLKEAGVHGPGQSEQGARRAEWPRSGQNAQALPGGGRVPGTGEEHSGVTADPSRAGTWWAGACIPEPALHQPRGCTPTTRAQGMPPDLACPAPRPLHASGGQYLAGRRTRGWCPPWGGRCPRSGRGRGCRARGAARSGGRCGWGGRRSGRSRPR